LSSSASFADDHERGRQRLKLTIAYQGQEFSGSQRQPGQRTIQSVLEGAIAALSADGLPVTFAGRTDAGVHALGQVASCLDPRPDLSDSQLRKALNGNLPDDVSVVAVERVENEFDPRRSATWRHYRYRIWVGPRQPMLRAHCLQLDGPLNVMRLLHGAVRFEGEHDFASFAGLGKGVPGAEGLGSRGTARRIHRARARSRTLRDYHGQVIEIDIVGDAFLPGQVRSMVGALIEVARGKKLPAWIGDLLAAADRRTGPKAAPAYGLTLMAVGYDEWDPGRIISRESGMQW
jgi:tRNA pseudouridine38-40 synthase